MWTDGTKRRSGPVRRRTTRRDQRSDASAARTMLRKKRGNGPPGFHNAPLAYPLLSGPSARSTGPGGRYSRWSSESTRRRLRGIGDGVFPDSHGSVRPSFGNQWEALSGNDGFIASVADYIAPSHFDAEAVPVVSQPYWHSSEPTAVSQRERSATGVGFASKKCWITSKSQGTASTPSRGLEPRRPASSAHPTDPLRGSACTP
jgi:hypothetical protein